MQHWEELAEARDEGWIEGQQNGRSQGELLNLITLIAKKLQKNKSVEIIADELEQDVEYVRQICAIAAKHAPDYDREHILEEMLKEQ